MTMFTRWNRYRDGIGHGVNRLKDSKAKSKVDYSLTDGVNNAGFIEPETAADIAK
jgi:Ca-activated chloride channel family protein